MRQGWLIAVSGIAALGLPIAAAARPGTQQSPTATKRATNPTPIQHVIIVMQENRSFDNYFSTYPGANGIPRNNAGVPTVCVPDPVHKDCVKPYHTTAVINGGGPHTQAAGTSDIDGGKMDGFIQTAENAGLGRSDVMSYHDSRELPNYWAYASDFVLQDRMFADINSYSLPTHLGMVSGWSARCTRLGDPSSCYDEPNAPANPAGPQTPDYSWTDLTYLLHNAGVTWGYYTGEGTTPDCNDGAATCPSNHIKSASGTLGIWNPLPYFDTVRQDGQLQNIQTVDNFYAAAANGTLPNVSWVVPGGSVSEHPPSSIAAGQSYVTSLINSVMRGPDWNSTAIFLSWDDWSGFYDHVPPPTVDPAGYGIRVPGLVISPYAKRGFIDHQTLSSDAYLKFIEDLFLGSARIDPTTDGRPDPRPDVRESQSILGNLMADFDFTQQPRPPFVLPMLPGAGPAPPVTPSPAGALSVAVNGTDNTEVGNHVPYVVTVTNQSASVLSGVRVTDTLPTGASVISHPAGCTVTAHQLTCAIGSVLAHASHVVPITLAFGRQGLALQSIGAIATGGATGGALEATSVGFLQLTATGPTSPEPGSPATYRLNVANTASALTATSVTVTDQLPSGAVFDSASPGCSQSAGVVTCNVGNLAPGANASYGVTVTPTQQMIQLNGIDLLNLGSGPKVTATSTNGGATEPDPPGVGQIQLLAVSATAPATAAPGDQGALDITVSNVSTDTTATAASLSDELPSNASFVSSSVPCSESSGVVTCALGDLTPGQAVSVTITVAFLNASFYINRATATSSNGGNASAVSSTYVNTAASASWPQFRGDNLHNGVYDGPQKINVNNVATLQQAWTTPTGSWVFSSPAIANGIVYVGSGDGALYALSLSSGAVLWKAQTGAELHVSPAVANGVVYSSSTDGTISAYDATDGQVLWTVTTGFTGASSPAVEGGVVYLAGGQDELLALSTADGSTIWQATLGGPVASSPAVAGGRVYVGDFDGDLYAFDATTGTLRWKAATGNIIYSSPTLADGLVYVGSEDKSFYAFDPASGALRWKYTTNGQCVASAPVANGTIYVASNDHSLYALDAATGGLLWKATTGNFLDASPAVSNGIVYEGSDDGALYAYNAYNGAQLWKYQLPDWIQSSPAVINGMVVVGDGRLPQQGTALDHNVYAFALPGAKPGSAT